jgi:hypothetical protein
MKGAIMFLCIIFLFNAYIIFHITYSTRFEYNYNSYSKIYKYYVEVNKERLIIIVVGLR